MACRVEVLHPVRLALDAATPVALIINEVITNALKHAFPDGRSGEILVMLDEVADGQTLVIQDNGVGLPADHGRRPGTSMGMRLVETLARQIEARIRFEAAAGVRFTLLLPKEASQP